MRFIALCFCFLLGVAYSGFAQQDSTAQAQPLAAKPVVLQPHNILDSVVMAAANRQKFIEDSIAFQYIKYPDSAMIYQAAAAYVRDSLYKGRYFLDIPYKAKVLYVAATPATRATNGLSG